MYQKSWSTLPSMPPKEPWLAYCRRLREAYPTILPEHRERTDYVSSYVLPEAIMRHAPDPLTVVTANGVARRCASRATGRSR